MPRARLALLVAAGGLGACGAQSDGTLGFDTWEMTICPKGAVVEGVDVAAYQPNTDWMKVKQSGREFAIVKATEGTGYVNKYFAQDYTGLKAAKMLRGAYHFFHANIDPVAQADFFTKTIGPVPDGDLPPVLDLEVTDGQAAATVAKNALAFLSEVAKKTGRIPMVYSSPSFVSQLGNPPGFAAYELWIANWQVQCPNVPAPWKGWPFWQYSDMGKVPGISTTVDLDRFNGTLDDLKAFAMAPAPPADLAALHDLALRHDLAGGDDAAAADDAATGGDDQASAPADAATGVRRDLSPAHGDASGGDGAAHAGNDVRGGCACSLGASPPARGGPFAAALALFACWLRLSLRRR